MKIEVVNSKVYSNPYQELLYSAIGSRYELSSGSVNKAIAQQRARNRGLFHIHWEESLFSNCTTGAEATRVRREFISKLKRYVAIGGKVIWTLHNVKPHEGKFAQAFFYLRKDLAAISHKILVHNQVALLVLQEQARLSDLSKVTILPHPAYFDVYEPSDRTQALAGQPPKSPRTLLHFGMVRAYKGIPDLVQTLSPEFMAKHQLSLHICGQPHRADSFLDELLAQIRQRPEIKCSLGSVPSNEVAELIRCHAGVVIPYHDVLTSGVAVLSLTLGVPTVAPNTLAMKELYPESSHDLLFDPSSVNDLHRAVLALVDMSPEARRKVAQDYIKQALAIHPKVISKALGAIYDGLVALQAEESDRTVTVLQTSTSLENSGPIGSSNGQLSREGDEIGQQTRASFLLELISENTPTATRSSKTATVLSNQQLALDLVKATLLGSGRLGISDDLILKNVVEANKYTEERARLDGAYAVRLYADILSRLEQMSAEQSAIE